MHPVIDILGLKLHVFPLILVLAIYICVLVFICSTKYDSHYFIWIKYSSIYCIVGAGIGGKLLYILTRIFVKNQSFLESLGGFVFYGGFIGSMLGTYIFCVKKNARFLDVLDTYVSLLPLGQAIGRIGCYFNGCCYGKESEGVYSVNYIVNGEKTKVIPTWFYESFFCLVLFICFFCISKRIFSGIYASLYMMFYALFRFVIERYRGDLARGIWYGLSTSQYISIAVFIFGVTLLTISIKIKDKNLIITGRV